MNKTKMTHDQFLAWAMADYEPEHDDLMDADDYDRRRFERDGWGDARYDRQRF